MRLWIPWKGDGSHAQVSNTLKLNALQTLASDEADELLRSDFIDRCRLEQAGKKNKGAYQAKKRKKTDHELSFC